VVSPRAIFLAATHAAAFTAGCAFFQVAIHQPHLKRDQALQLQAEKRARQAERDTTEIAQAIRDEKDTKQAEVRYVTQEIIKAVPLYLPAERLPLPGVRGGAEGAGGTALGHDLRGDGGGSSAPVHLPVGFGRLHDYAALGVDPPVPAPSGEPLAASSGIDLPALAVTLAGNYGVCHADRAEVRAWREWYQREVAAWPSK
jgi:hypothetical protein